MSVLLLGLVIFFAIHSVSIFNDTWRDRMAAAWGEMTWRGMYSLASIAGIVLIVWGYALARYDPIVLYVPPLGLRYVAIMLLAPVFPLLLSAYLPGRIQAAAKHPMLAAIKLWAFAHLLANGSLADVLLFGTFLAWAVLNRISMKRRSPRAPLAAPRAKYNDAVALILGLAFYVVFGRWLHAWLIGVSPLGMTS